MSWATQANADVASRAQVFVQRAAAVVVDEVAGPGTTTDTRFALWSVSKVLAAVTVLSLIDDGQLALDTRISAVVPAFGQAGKEDVTVREVLLHIGGFPEPPDFHPSVFLDPEAGTDELCRLPRQPDLVGVVSYHGLAYGILGPVVERVGGAAFADLAHERVLAPLGMTSTTWGVPADTDDVAVAPAPDLDLLRTVCEAGGCAFGAWSTARDVAAALMMLRHDGEGPHGRVLSPASARGMTTAHAHGPVVSTGFGTFIGTAFARGSHVSAGTFGHSGATAVQAICDPERDITIVALTDSHCTQADSDARFDALCDGLVSRHGR
jgi:CubicO group peptidase (beta-lactamase class C family)